MCRLFAHITNVKLVIGLKLIWCPTLLVPTLSSGIFLKAEVKLVDISYLRIVDKQQRFWTNFSGPILQPGLEHTYFWPNFSDPILQPGLEHAHFWTDFSGPILRPDFSAPYSLISRTDYKYTMMFLIAIYLFIHYKVKYAFSNSLK